MSNHIAPGLVALALLLVGCSPKIGVIRPVDLSAGYNKSLLVEVKPRLAQRVVLTAELRVEDHAYSAEAKLGEHLQLIGSSSLKAGAQANYRVTATYSWPLSKKRRARIAEGLISVDRPARLSPELPASCVAVGDQVTSTWSFMPRAVIDPVPMSVGALSVASASPPGGSALSTISTELRGVEVGREDLELIHQRDNIETLSQSVSVVPNERAPTGLSSGAPKQNEVVPEPPEVDGWQGGAHALRWKQIPGALEYSLEINRSGGALVESLLVPGDRVYAVTWLSNPGSYSWRLRARIPTCAGSSRWSEFSERVVLP